MPRLVFPRAMQMPERALQILDLPFVVDFLSFGKLESLEHFLHFIE